MRGEGGVFGSESTLDLAVVGVGYGAVVAVDSHCVVLDIVGESSARNSQVLTANVTGGRRDGGDGGQGSELEVFVGVKGGPPHVTAVVGDAGCHMFGDVVFST